MFSSIIRFGIALSGAALLSSCGGSSGQALTQQSTPEGLFTGTAVVPITTTTLNPDGTNVTINQTQNALAFVVLTGAYYVFYTDPLAPTVVSSASSGTFTFSGGGMTAAGTISVNPPISMPITVSGSTQPVTVTQVGSVSSPSFTGAYNTAQNIAGTFTFPTIAPTPTVSNTIFFNLPYNIGYQNTQDLSTLAGTYTGTVATSTGAETATFTFGPASVQANSGNEFGVGIVTGTGADGCAYTGTVSPLYKGNGYTLIINSGSSPCTLPNTQFTGLVYYDATNNFLYSFSPNAAHSDGVIFTGSRI